MNDLNLRTEGYIFTDEEFHKFCGHLHKSLQKRLEKEKKGKEMISILKDNSALRPTTLGTPELTKHWPSIFQERPKNHYRSSQNRYI